MSTTFAETIIDFNRHLHYSVDLPEGFQVMNLYRDNPGTIDVMKQFYHNALFFKDNASRPPVFSRLYPEHKYIYLRDLLMFQVPLP